MLTYRIRILACLWILGSASLAFAQPAEEPAAPDVPEAPVDPAADPATASTEEATAEAPAEATAEATGEASAEVAADEPTIAEAPAEAQSPAPDDDMVITGTRTKTSFGGSAAPVEIVDRKQLAKSGYTNLPDLIKDMTGVQGSGTQGAVGIGAGGGAASALNLRGLGNVATLILLNGRRMTPSGAAIGVSDLSAVPFTAVERIEVLKAGAAAIYGADAVGGVVNIITRRNFNGLRLSADGQSTTRWDHGEYTLSGSLGSMSDTSRVLISASYFRRSELTGSERKFAFTPDKFIANTNASTFGTFYPNGRPPAFADPACPNPSQIAAVPPAMPGTSCPYPYVDYISLFPDVERTNAFASGQFDLSDHVSVNAELLVSRYRGSNIAPTFSFNPPYATIPASHVDNASGMPLSYAGRPRGGTQVSSGADDTFRGMLGLSGDFSGVGAGTMFESWTWELSTTAGISRFRLTNDDNIRPEFQNALNSCSDPSNLRNCFNPFSSANDGTGTPNSEAVYQSFTGRQSILTDHSLQTYHGGLAGSLFPLPGGPVGVALGAELRREARSGDYDHDANQLRYGFLGGSLNYIAKRSVYSGYLELRWPFIRGIELQTAARLESYTDTEATPSPFAALTVSVGDLIGREQAPRLAQRLTLRGNIARAFRAPTVVDTYSGVSTTPQAVSAPGRPPAFAAVRTTGNPDIEPETAITASGGFNWSPHDILNITADYWYYDYSNRIQLQNPNLVVAAAALTPDLPHPEVELDANGNVSVVYIRPVNIDQPVSTSGIDFSVMLQIDGSKFGGAVDDFGQISAGASGSFTIDYDVPRSEVARGAQDFVGCEQQWVNTPMGAPPAPAPDPNSRCQVAGHRNAPAGVGIPALPRWKVNFPLSWGFAGHSLTATGHFISGWIDDPPPNSPDVALNPGWYNHPAWFTLDLQYGFTLEDIVGKSLGFRVGVLNVADKLPAPVYGAFTAYEAEIYDIRGRMVYAKLDAEF